MEEKLKALQGKTLLTWPRGREFEIVEVATGRVVFVPKRGNGTQRWESTQTILDVARRTWDASELRQKVQEEYPKTRNSSYIAAIAKAIR